MRPCGAGWWPRGCGVAGASSSRTAPGVSGGNALASWCNWMGRIMIGLRGGGTICMHAENGDVIDVLVRRALAEGHTAPKWHALTRPPRAEAEATYRAICLAEMAGVPLYVVHLSAAEARQI